MKLYHGSNMPIEEIDLTLSHRGKDFGCGFYLSDNYEQAFRMACLTVERTETGVPTVTTYDFNENILDDKDLDVRRYDGYTEEWAQFVLNNRSNRKRENIHGHDIVIGPIANDKVGAQIRRFQLGDIDIHQLVMELTFHKGLTTQYFFATERAIKMLKKI